MGNVEYRTVAGGPGQGAEHFLLCQRIQMGIHFIQQEEGRLEYQGPGNGKELLFSF